MTPSARFWFVIGGGLALLGVILEAYGAHALREGLGPERWNTFQVASRNHMYHALGLLAVGAAGAHAPGRLLDAAGWLLVAGIGLFSGSLYLAAVTDVAAFRALPGLGGLAFAGGWAALVAGVLRPPAEQRAGRAAADQAPPASETR
jgi:uncharacterized membrane protein YgdD (TMEM256/DUF423 family)